MTRLGSSSWNGGEIDPPLIKCPPSFYCCPKTEHDDPRFWNLGAGATWVCLELGVWDFLALRIIHHYGQTAKQYYRQMKFIYKDTTIKLEIYSLKSR